MDLNGLLSKLRREICHSFLQLLHSAMLLEKLVKQHRVNLVVAYRVDSATLVAHHKVRIYLFHFFGYNPNCDVPAGSISFL